MHRAALRTQNEEEYHAWTERLSAASLQHSGEIDRYGFRSLFFRDPNGTLFEIATDGPGFMVDEDEAMLGEKVIRPPFLESRREQLARNPKPID